MNLKKRLIGGLALLTLSFASCEKNKLCVSGEGDMVTRTLSINSFSEIDLQASAIVRIHQGTEQMVVATGHSNIIDLIETDISGNRWEIEMNRNCIQNYELTIDITMATLTEVDLSGSGDIVINDFTDNENLLLKISGSGDIDMNNHEGLKTFQGIISGSGNIVALKPVPGVETLDMIISGSGNIHMYNLGTDNSDLLISGSGNIQTTTHSHMDVRISGSGNVYYKGHPGINANISGSGNLINRN